MKNLSLICYHFLKKFTLNYLTKIKKQSSSNRLWLIAMCDVTLQFICLYICFSSILNIAPSDSLVEKLTSISDLNVWLVLDDKVCEPSTSSYRINLSNNFIVCISLIWWNNNKIIKNNNEIIGIGISKILFCL